MQTSCTQTLRAHTHTHTHTHRGSVVSTSSANRAVTWPCCLNWPLPWTWPCCLSCPLTKPLYNCLELRLGCGDSCQAELLSHHTHTCTCTCSYMCTWISKNNCNSTHTKKELGKKLVLNYQDNARFPSLSWPLTMYIWATFTEKMAITQKESTSLEKNLHLFWIKTTPKKLVLKYQVNARFPSLYLAPERHFWAIFTQNMAIIQ